MRILLTGAGGYIGLHIARELLDAGHDLTVLVRSPHKLGPLARVPRLRVVTADLEHQARVAQSLEGQQVCVHAALIWGDADTELELRDTSISAKLFEAAGQAGVKRCLYISSAAVHRPFSAEMHEDDRLSTSDVYGATKAATELFLRAACAKHGMTGVVMRPGPTVGAPAFPSGSFRTDRRIGELMLAAKEGRPLEVIEGEGRQLSDVLAVATATRLLASLEQPHPTYLCVDRDILTWEWIARQVVACMSSSSEIRALPRKEAGPVPRFRTERLQELLGGPADARQSLLAHLQHLAQSMR